MLVSVITNIIPPMIVKIIPIISGYVLTCFSSSMLAVKCVSHIEIVDILRSSVVYIYISVLRPIHYVAVLLHIYRTVPAFLLASSEAALHKGIVVNVARRKEHGFTFIAFKCAVSHLKKMYQHSYHSPKFFP